MTCLKKPRCKKCKVCQETFQPTRPMQAVCSPACALAKVKTDQAKQERKTDRERKQKLKTRSEWMKEAQVVFNRYIRLRDSGRPCICCGRFMDSDGPGGEWDAGHYRSVGSAPHLRFHEDNAHKQSKQHNRYGAGRAVDYRIGLIGRIGIERVEALEADQTPRHYTIDDLKQIIATYKAKIKEMER
jgi:hypothetical protein